MAGRFRVTYRILDRKVIELQNILGLCLYLIVHNFGAKNCWYNLEAKDVLCDEVRQVGFVTELKKLSGREMYWFLEGLERGYKWSKE